MSAIVKTKLKNAREFLSQKNYEGAKKAALDVLQYDSNNYNATVFLGLASLELRELTESEQAYKKAIEINPDQPLAWQGLSQFYDRSKDWGKYADVLRRMIDLYALSNDAVKCAETLQKYIDSRREHGTSTQIIASLSLLLPDSPLYDVLSTLPPPDPTSPASTTTYQVQEHIYDSLTVMGEMIALLERDEEAFAKAEFEKRRTRLNAGTPDQIKMDIGREIWGTSRLPSLYNEILNHPKTSDILRRETDSKLLRYKQKYMRSLPVTAEYAQVKAKVAQELNDLIDGAVILQIPDELAWSLFLDAKDVETIEEYGFSLLRRYIELFPSHPLTSVLRGYFIYMRIPLAEDEDDGDMLPEEPDVGYDMILEAYPALLNSLLAARILAEVYLHEVDYPNAIQIADNGVQLATTFEMENGKSLSKAHLAFKVILATSLVHLFPPKHHRRAMGIIDEILEISPENIAGLMGKAYVLQAVQKWTEAGDLFARVHELLPEDQNNGLKAREEYAWCISRRGNVDGGIIVFREVIQTLSGLEGRGHDRARAHWRLGKCLWDLGSKHNEAYQNFITSLKCDSTYAPAFTSLGIFYSEFTAPPDPTRASKCFQKAFELDSREADAAYRLAKGFAEEQEWDLVEVVARRTIEGEGGLEGGITVAEENATGRYLPTNTWAWKALGAVNLIHRNYIPAISALQIALRAEPNDHLTWLRLGEAYYRSGRHSAALKALGRARELKDEDWLCCYFIAEVLRQTGQYQEAIHQLREVLDRASEVCVLIALAQAYLELGRSELASSFVARAEASLIHSVRFAVSAVKSCTGFRAAIWKIAADAIFHLSTPSSFCDEEAICDALGEVIHLLPTPSNRISGLLPSISLENKSPLNCMHTIEVVIAVQDHRITLGSSEDVAVGSAWFDFAVSLQSLFNILPPGDRHDTVAALVTKSFVEAIRIVPNNDAYWRALGDAYFTTQPTMAQHAYIRSLEIDSKNPVTWTNLGLLSFHHTDLELANEAFYRAQSADPDYTLAWLGQALVAISSGHVSGATGILEHAVGLANVMCEADYQYASWTFSRQKNLPKAYTTPSYDKLIPSFFVLDRYVKSRPNDASALHLFGLVCEIVNQHELGVDLINRAISILEASYEETEDVEIERQFTIAHSNVGRLKLSLHDYDGALASFESALGLLPEVNDGATTILRAQGQFMSGIAHFRLGQLDTAVELFETALETAGDNVSVKGEVTVLLAQTLWALGSDGSREHAKSLLLECVSTDPENLIAINTLAALGILTEDDNLIDAALSEILNLPAERRLELDPQQNVDRLLILHYLDQDDTPKALAVAQSAVLADPTRPDARKQLATLLFQVQQHGSVLPILSGPAPPTLDKAWSSSLKLRALAETVASKDRGDSSIALRLAQRAVMIRPSDMEGWRTLAFASSSAMVSK